mmetsp:Transcript_6186/g.9721  ORF Transcript_6186/g.9721 Transcript_6186/m.9721 type:complete len:462 (-) Transcript_6186:686-2071(-)
MGFIDVHMLGAARCVGKSCIVVKILGRLFMLDCGIELGSTDEKRNPDFGSIDVEQISCCIVTHFHLDHCGALPMLTERHGYRGPVLMTAPTQAFCPVMLEDHRKVLDERYGLDREHFFTQEMVQQAVARTTTIGLGEEYILPSDPDVSIIAYHAGHVLGAAMFEISVRSGDTCNTVFYTGDYNMTPDRYLAPANLNRVYPKRRIDVLLTEATYATTIRESRLSGERDLLRAVHRCVEQGGKVLIPVFALGRAQELCALIDKYWKRTGIQNVPVYYATGLAEKATNLYKKFSNWTGVGNDVFDYEYVSPWKFTGAMEEKVLDSRDSMVLLATSATLEGGLSLKALVRWASDKNNLVIMPGHCVGGTLGHQLQHNMKHIKVTHKGTEQTLNIECMLQQESFSAHTDAKGIMDLLETLQPANCVLVHGEKHKMTQIMKTIQGRTSVIRVAMPAQGSKLRFPAPN